MSNLIFQPTVGADVPIRIETKTSNQGIRLSTRYSFVAGLILGASVELISGLIIGLTDRELDRFENGLIGGLFFGVIAGLIGGFAGGGDAVVKHCILRVA